MKDSKENIKNELRDLEASKLEKLSKHKFTIPTDMQNKLLEKVNFEDKKNKSSKTVFLKFALSAGMAAILVIGIFLFSPTQENSTVSWENISTEDLEYFITENISNYSTEDVSQLVAENSNLFEFNKIESEDLEFYLLEDDQLELEELFN